MTPTTQREPLAVLAEIWALSPDVRLGQLLAHLGFLGEAHLGRGLGEIDDDELLAILYRHRSELNVRTSSNDATTSREPDPSMPVSVSGSPAAVETSTLEDPRFHNA